MKRKKKKIYHQHAEQRFAERYGESEVSKEKLLKVVKERNPDYVRFAKRLTHSRSLIYVEIGNEIFKIVLRRDTNEPITFLQMRTDHKDIPRIYVCENNVFKILVYPDCYLETKNKYGAADFYTISNPTEDEMSGKVNIDSDRWTSCSKSSSYFSSIFNQAWEAWSWGRTDEETSFETQKESETCPIEKAM